MSDQFARTHATGRPRRHGELTSYDWLLGRLDTDGITYRQLDYWINRFPGQFSDGTRAGKPGLHRDYTDHDVRVLRRIARLTGAGLRLDVAGPLPDSAFGYYRLSRHVVLRLAGEGRPQ